MFNIAELDSNRAPRISYYNDDVTVSGLPTLWDDPQPGTVKVAVFRLSNGDVYITSDAEAVEFAESYC